MNKLAQYRILEKAAYIRSSKSISVPGESAKGALLGGLTFTPYGMQSVSSHFTKGMKGKRKAFAIPVAIGAGLGSLSRGMTARGEKKLIEARGKGGLKEVNYLERENRAARKGETRGLFTGMAGGGIVGAGVGKALSKLKRFKGRKGMSALTGLAWGASMAGLGGSVIGKHEAIGKFKLRNT